MNDRNRPDDNLYAKPDKKPVEAPSARIAPTRARARTHARMLWTTLLMIGLLVGAALFVDRYEGGEESELEESELQESDATKTDAEAPTAQLMIPELKSMGEVDFPDESLFPRAPRDPETLAQATEAVRDAHRLMKEGEWERAEVRVRQALEIWPAMNSAQRVLGAVLTQRGQFDQAISILERALSTDPFSPETYSNLAAAHLHKGNFEKAERYLETALKMKPDFVVARLNLGLLYLATGQYSYAEEALGEALPHVPNRTEVRNNLAVAQMRIGKYEESREHLQLLIRQDPKAVHPYFNMAITFVLEGNFETAMDWIRRGAEYCSPIAFQQFMTDSDFRELQGMDEFQTLVEDIYGELPEYGPGAMPETEG